MSDTLPDLSSWLPSDFLSGDFDHIKPPHVPNRHHHHFPYDFASSSSTESESDDDELTGLTLRFTRSVSLQERLHNTFPFQKMGFSGSCPTTPFPLDNEWEQVHAAAERVARMKMQIMNTTSNDDVLANRVDIVPPRHLGPTQTHHHHCHHLDCSIWRSENEDHLRLLHFRNRVSLNGGGYLPTGRPVGFRQSAWPTLRVETPRRHQNAPVKKECAGTGVFLPRSYSPNPPEIKKKTGGGGCHFPANRVMNKNMNMMGPPQPTNIQQYPCSQYHHPPHYNITRDELEELVMARRTAMMLAQQRRICTSRVAPPEPQMGQHHPEALLPQEWTY
uniref:uncharacterized protein LOC122605549 isoform X2 n=1 Tax=Erigeron canadensis TaxID=72917 RepID=UPI001CB90B8C|nr:uncharacterized protein LOC122605549 isoform X2 [Erigeron canadensis]